MIDSQEPERLVPRFFQEDRHVDEITGYDEDSEERDIWFVQLNILGYNSSK